MAAKKEFVRLTESDFEILLPSTVVKLGKTNVTVAPLDIHDSQYFMACMREEWPQLEHELTERGITENNFEERLFDVSEIILTRSPMLIAVLTDVHPEDAARLPTLAVFELLEAVIAVNFRDRDFFEIVSTMRRVADNMTKALATGDIAAGMPDSPPSRKHSSKADTRGRRSRSTRGANSERSTSQPPSPSESSANQQ